MAICVGSVSVGETQSQDTINSDLVSDGFMLACKSLRQKANSENKIYSTGFDNAIDMARSEPWAKNIDFDRTDSARMAGCYKAIILSGEAVRFLELRLGITPSETMPEPSSLPYKASYAASLTWPALVMMEKFGLLSEQKDTAQAAKQSLLNGITKLVERDASVDCIAKFVHNLTYGLQVLDLVGQSSEKKQMLIEFATANDAGVGSMIDQCLPSLPESCWSICN